MQNFLDVFGAYNFATRQALVLTLVGLSIYVLLRAGIFAVPQVGFMAVGSYTSALLSLKSGFSFPLALLCSILLTGVFAALVGALLIRVSGIYLALASIGLAEMIRVIIVNSSFTGGAQGLYGVPRDANDIWVVSIVVVAMLFVARLSATRFGAAMAMIREDPLIARHVGISVDRYRVLLFALSGVLAGLGGSLFVHQSGFVDPGQYSFDLLTAVLATVILGGMGYVFGPIIGSVIIFGLPLAFTGLVQYSAIVNGGLIVFVIAVAPKGVVGLVVMAVRRIAHRPLRLVRLGLDSEDGPGLEASSGGATVSALSNEPVLAVHSVRKHFGGIVALSGVGIEVAKGEVLGVIGPNGSGKTSLLNVLSGAYRPDEGSGTCAGVELDGMWGRPDRIARLGLARTFQGIRLVQDATVLENLMMGAVSWHRSSFFSTFFALPRARRENAILRQRADVLLSDLGMRSEADAVVGALPYGAQRKVEIARALMSEPTVLMLDEPTAGMTPVERDEIFRLVRVLRDGGLAIIVVEHDVEVMVRHCDRMVVLNFGREIAAGLPEAVMREEVVVDAYIGSAS